MQQQDPIFISVIIPCFNEDKFIGKCLDSIITNGYPLDRLEVLVIDGNSTDKTREIIEHYVEKHPFIKLLENPRRILASAWNIGIGNGKGEVIMAMNAHGVYRKDYLSKCIKYLNEYNADFVGGIIITLPRNDTHIGQAIATTLSHPFGVGNSYFRVGSKSPTWADTAAFGGYRKNIFEKTGLFNEELARSQDMEFHSRMKKVGCKILLVPDMICDYYIRSSLREFCRDDFINGFWVIYPLKFTTFKVSLRHLIPLIFVLSLIGLAVLSHFSIYFGWILIFTLGVYTLLSVYFSSKIFFKKRDVRYLFTMPMLFAVLHIGYGFGSCYAGLKILGSKRFWKNLKLFQMK